MHRTPLAVVLFATLLSGSFTDVACAMYNLTAGRWLQRDPLRYVDGLNTTTLRSGPLTIREVFEFDSNRV
jgi:hypothetical protein